MQSSSSQNTNFLRVITPRSWTVERERRGERAAHCLELGDACMSYGSDKWKSAPASKIGSNLLICSCQLCFCVASGPGQLTGRCCKWQSSEAISNPCLNRSQSCYISMRTKTTAAASLDASLVCVSAFPFPFLPWRVSCHWWALNIFFYRGNVVSMFILCFFANSANCCCRFFLVFSGLQQVKSVVFFQFKNLTWEGYIEQCRQAISSTLQFCLVSSSIFLYLFLFYCLLFSLVLSSSFLFFPLFSGED